MKSSKGSNHNIKTKIRASNLPEITATNSVNKEVGDVPIRIVSDEEAEESDFVVCCYAGQEKDEYKADNIYTQCVDCGKDITHRPHVPKKPPKICISCIVKRAETLSWEGSNE